MTSSVLAARHLKPLFGSNGQVSNAFVGDMENGVGDGRIAGDALALKMAPGGGEAIRFVADAAGKRR